VPEKFHIHTEPAPPRLRPVGKLGIVDWREDCANCHNCVKRACVYGLYRDEADTLHDEVGYLDYIYQCKGCLNCIQDCTKGILTRVINPEYERLGDDYYTPDTILSTWFQAETGRIPVSGAGYGGPFCGPGFDSMWTDMSEIVRPTRDGIHGREYINTGIDIGRRLPHLSFEDGRLTASPPPLLTSPMPVMFEVVPEQWRRGAVPGAIVDAAAEIGLPVIVRARDAQRDATRASTVIPLLDRADAGDAFPGAPMVIVPDGDDVEALRTRRKERNADQIVSIRVVATPRAAERVLELVRGGAEVVHLVFNSHGLEDAPTKPRHMRDVLREVHLALVKDRTRDLVTLVASGGIAMAEHVTKAMLCGADMVAVDVPLIVALECRLCNECRRGERCPVALDEVDAAYAVRRVVNLMGAWHQQLIEMLGAMGIREARRLRGEVGRCMFFEDLERDSFGRLFGERKAEQGARLQ
jgi:ferredoxin